MGLDAWTTARWATWAITLICSTCWEPQTIFRLLKTSLRKLRGSYKQKESTYLESQMSWLKEKRIMRILTANTNRVCRINWDSNSSIALTKRSAETWAIKRRQVPIQTPFCTGLISTWMSSPQQTRRITIRFTSKTRITYPHFTMMISRKGRRSLNLRGSQIMRPFLAIRETRAISLSARTLRCNNQ